MPLLSIFEESLDPLLTHSMQVWNGYKHLQWNGHPENPTKPRNGHPEILTWTLLKHPLQCLHITAIQTYADEAVSAIVQLEVIMPSSLVEQFEYNVCIQLEWIGADEAFCHWSCCDFFMQHHTTLQLLFLAQGRQKWTLHPTYWFGGRWKIEDGGQKPQCPRLIHRTFVVDVGTLHGMWQI